MSDNILDEEEKPVKVKRRKNGTFAKGVSGNAAGRTPNSTNKINKAKVVTAINKNLVNTLNKILLVGDKALAKDELNTALRAYTAYAAEGLKLLTSQERLANDMAKLAAKGDNAEDNQDDEVGQAIIEFQRFGTTDE